MITIPRKYYSLIPVNTSHTFNDGDTAEFLLIDSGNTLLRKELIQNGDDYALELLEKDTADIPVGYYQYTIIVIHENEVVYSFDGKAFVNEVNTSGSVIRGGETINNAINNYPDNECIHSNTTYGWNSDASLVGVAGHIYIYTDYAVIEKDGVALNVPNIKIGDGNAFLIDNPFITESIEELMNMHIEDTLVHVTSVEKNLWNSKVRCYIDANDNENIVFTTS